MGLVLYTVIIRSYNFINILSMPYLSVLYFCVKQQFSIFICVNDMLTRPFSRYVGLGLLLTRVSLIKLLVLDLVASKCYVVEVLFDFCIVQYFWLVGIREISRPYAYAFFSMETTVM